MRGGMYKVEANLSGLKLASLVLTRGFSDVDLTLPEPSGMVPVRLTGGASEVNIRRPAGVEARPSMIGGVSKRTFDEQSFDAVGGKLRLRSPRLRQCLRPLRDRGLRRRQQGHHSVSQFIIRH